MGFKVVEEITFRTTGITLAGTEYTIHAGYEVTKKDGKFTIESTADVYAGPDHTKRRIDVMHVVIKNLSALPADITAALYTELKSSRRFVGKTLIDN